jgi:uncharacterized protein (TIGR00251 family)
MATTFHALVLTVAKEGVRFEVHAKPRAKRSALVGVREGALDVAIGAPPVEGAANAELIAFLAGALGVAKRDVVLVRGEGSRTKLVEVRGLTPDEVRARLAAG